MTEQDCWGRHRRQFMGATTSV